MHYQRAGSLIAHGGQIGAIIVLECGCLRVDVSQWVGAARTEDVGVVLRVVAANCLVGVLDRDKMPF